MDTETQAPGLETGTSENPASRRRVLIATSATVLGVAGAATLAACGGSSSDATSASSAGTQTSAAAGSGGGLATPEAVHVEVAALTDVPQGGAKAASVNGLNLLVTRPTADTAKIFTSVCPHQGCAVAPNGTTDLACPCHGSTFDIATGKRLGGVAPYGLASYEAAVEGGKVYLTSTTAQNAVDQS